jgi:hypothetical protein
MQYDTCLIAESYSASTVKDMVIRQIYAKRNQDAENVQRNIGRLTVTVIHYNARIVIANILPGITNAQNVRR